MGSRARALGDGRRAASIDVEHHRGQEAGASALGATAEAPGRFRAQGNCIVQRPPASPVVRVMSVRAHGFGAEVSFTACPLPAAQRHVDIEERLTTRSRQLIQRRQPRGDEIPTSGGVPNPGNNNVP
jgi:hypothetical protein